MTTPDPNYIIDRFLIPRMDSLEDRLEKLDTMVLEGTPWGQKEASRVQKEINDLRQAIVELRKELLSPDTVADLINKAMQKAKARGWTNRERGIGVALFIVAIASLAINAIKAF